MFPCHIVSWWSKKTNVFDFNIHSILRHTMEIWDYKEKQTPIRKDNKAKQRSVSQGGTSLGNARAEGKQESHYTNVWKSTSVWWNSRSLHYFKSAIRSARLYQMASSPQKSPSSPKSPTPKSPSSRKKDETFLGKLGGTLARRKKAKEGVHSAETHG